MRDFIFESIGRLDLLIWMLVILFFCGSAMLFDGDIQMAFIGSAGIIFEMLLIGISIEIIIEILKTTKGIGTITGFITNGYYFRILNTARFKFYESYFIDLCRAGKWSISGASAYP